MVYNNSLEFMLFMTNISAEARTAKHINSYVVKTVLNADNISFSGRYMSFEIFLADFSSI
jgi:hypothetical protein